MTSLPSKTRPIAWVSGIRITATLMIFVFHFDCLYGFPHYSLGSWGIGLLLFLSGFLAARPGGSPHRWFQRRLATILIPYWPVVGFVIVANAITQYKSIPYRDCVVEFLGFGAFNREKVYTISYFITVILLFYLLTYAIKLQPHPVWKILLAALGAYAFCVRFPYFVEFVASYLAGYGVRSLADRWEIPFTFAFRSSRANRANELLFRVQNHAYAFFLLHGGVLVFLSRFLQVAAAPAFAIGLVGTSLICVFHKWLTNLAIVRVNGYAAQLPILSG